MVGKEATANNDRRAEEIFALASQPLGRMSSSTFARCFWLSLALLDRYMHSQATIDADMMSSYTSFKERTSLGGIGATDLGRRRKGGSNGRRRAALSDSLKSQDDAMRFLASSKYLRKTKSRPDQNVCFSIVSAVWQERGEEGKPGGRHQGRWALASSLSSDGACES